MKDEILRFVEPVYRFCLKRLNHSEAEDLSQEILLCVLQALGNGQTTNIKNIDGYVWKVARNRYARKISEKLREATVVHGDEYLAGLCEETSPGGEQSEEHNAVFKALHTLSAAYRDILVAYYVHGLDVREISLSRKISVETVKWRLHAGREKIRERINEMEKTYEYIKMHIMCNGSFSPNQYLSTQLYKAIAKACYFAPRSVEEISLATGVPTLYLEEALEHMCFGDALEKVGKKYTTDFIITSDEQNKKMRAFLDTAVVGEITDIMLGYITENKSALKDIGFYGGDFPDGHLLYIYIPALVYSVAERHRLSSPVLPKTRPPRKDGGNGWFIVTEGIERIDGNFSGCNAYHFDSKGGQAGKFIYYWVGDTFSDELNRTLRNSRFYLNSVGPGNACMFEDEMDSARAAANNLCYMEGGRVCPSIPIFTEEQYKKFISWAAGCKALDKVWVKWIETLIEEYKSFTPKRLAGQIGGNADSYSFNLSAFALRELTKRGLVNKAGDDEVFTKNLLLIRG